MAGQLIVPGTNDPGLLKPEVEAAIIVVNNLAPILQGIQNQLDLLLRIETGVLHRTTLRKRIQMYDELEKAGKMTTEEVAKDDTEETDRLAT